MASIVTLSRLLSVACMLVAAGLGSVRVWVALFAYALLSDVIDGPIARALGTASERGAMLDSIADCALYLTVPVAALLLFPWLRVAEGAVILTITVAYAAPVACGFCKFRRLTSYHTTAARIAGVLVCSAFLLLLAIRLAWPLHLAAVVLVVSALEEIAITVTLPAWRSGVPSLWHAVREVRVASTESRVLEISQPSN
jgi:phosphatidylglycerophosphate synthase